MLAFNHLAVRTVFDIHTPAFSMAALDRLRTIDQYVTPAALTINVRPALYHQNCVVHLLMPARGQMFVGDMIVWWRALVFWEGRKHVRCVCGICLLVATFGTLPSPPSCRTALTRAQG